MRGSPGFASSLQKALISAADGDDFLKKKGKHDSGWGGVWYSDSDEKYYRTTTPIFSDPSAAQFFEGNNPLMGLSHARLAAKGEPIRGPFDSHPFSTHINEELVYVTHNGHIDKFKLKNETGIEDPSTINDTEVFTFLLEKVEGSSAKKRMEGALKVVRERGANVGALNLMLLSITRGGEKKIYYHCEFPDNGRELYYSLYVLRDSKTNSAVMSSTVAYKAGFINRDGEPLTPKVLKCPVGKTLAL